MNKGYYSVSRIDEGIAVLEFPDGEFREVDISLLPDGVKEGNILIKNQNNEFIFDFEEERRKKDRLLELQNKIFG